MNWLLTYNSQTKSFSDWGLSNLHRTRVSQAQDTVSFTAPGPYDANSLFPYGSIIEISFETDSGEKVKWFYGRVIQIPRSGSGSEESMDYVLAGPWWYLDNLVYQQSWKTGPDPEDIIYKSRVILGQDTSGNRQTSGAVITEVINYAIDSGAPITLGTIEPDLQVPFDEQNDITCAEAIRRMLRWSSDAATWFDYSTEPYPTFNCARRSALSSLTLDLPIENRQSQIANLQIIPRPDIQVPAVVLKFEQTNTIDDIDYESVTIDKYPEAATGREFGALTATIQLAGFQLSYLSQKIVTEPIGDYTQASWWKEKDPSLPPSPSTVEIESGTISSSLPNRLKEGQIQDWMNKDFDECLITAIATITYKDAGETVKTEKRALSYTCIATDAETRTYWKLASLISGEAIPEGLAQAIYNSLNPLQYEGSITLTEEECCSNDVAAVLRTASGFKLNLTGGLAAWATMNALIQQIEEHVDSGQTTISFGPAEQLSVPDLMEFLRANRGRGIAFSYQKRTTGQSASNASSIELSGPTPLLNTAGASGQTKLLVVTNDIKKFTLDPALITAEGATELKPVAAEVIVEGEKKTINVLASEDFSAGGTDELTVVTNKRYDASTRQLQTKTRKVKVVFIDGEEESAWTMIEGGQAEGCP